MRERKTKVPLCIECSLRTENEVGTKRERTIHPSLPGTSFCRYHTKSEARAQHLAAVRILREGTRPCRSDRVERCAELTRGPSSLFASMTLPELEARVQGPNTRQARTPMLWASIIPFDWFPIRLRAPSARLAIPERFEAPVDSIPSPSSSPARLLHRASYQGMPWAKPRCFESFKPEETEAAHRTFKRLARLLAHDVALRPRCAHCSRDGCPVIERGSVRDRDGEPACPRHRSRRSALVLPCCAELRCARPATTSNPQGYPSCGHHKKLLVELEP